MDVEMSSVDGIHLDNMDVEIGDVDRASTPQSEPCHNDGNLLPSTSLSPKAQAALQSCRAETDFDSYYAFLDFHRSVVAELGILTRDLDGLPIPRESIQITGGVGSRVMNVSKDCYISLSAPHSDVHQTNIIEALCDPPSDAQLQIVIWSLSSHNHLLAQGDVIDFLGLHFSLDPPYFLTLRSLFDEAGNLSSTGWQDRYIPTRTKIGNATTAVCRPRDRTDGIPILLISVVELVGSTETERKAFYPRPPLIRSRSWDSHLASLQGLGSYQFYPQALTRLLESHKKTQVDFTNLLLICIFPCFQSQLVRLHSLCGATRVVFDCHQRASTTEADHPYDPYEKVLDRNRTWVRRRICEIEDEWSDLVRYMKLCLSWDPYQSPLFRDFGDEIDHVIGEANRLENEIREYSQLRAGTLGLEESRRSIDLSNRQIEEAKRVKIFTVLAFVYIPLNLATSVFGMNLQQLNGNGQSVVDFVLTALLALIITGVAWYTIELVNGYQNWQEGRYKKTTNKGFPPSYSVAERIGMIVWLVRNSLGPWMIRTGAWSRIIFNSNKPFYDHDSPDSAMPVGDLVSRDSASGRPWLLKYYGSEKR